MQGTSTETLGRGAILLLALLAACSEEPTAPTAPGDFKAAVTPARAWQGDTLTLEWDWLAGRADMPVFRVGDSTATAMRLDDRRVRIVVPPAAAGPARVAAVIDGATVPLGTVETFGWARSDPVPGLAAARPWPSPAGTEVIGIAGDGALTVVDLATGASRATSPSPYTGSIVEVGLSYRPGVAIIHQHDHSEDSATGWARLWRIDPEPVLLDSVWTSNSLHYLYEIGPGRYLRHHNGDTWITTDGEVSSTFPGTGAGRVVPSPGWDRILLYNVSAHRPVFVLDAASGEPAYSLAGYESLIHGAFTADGLEAFLVVADEVPGEGAAVKVARIIATTGHVLAETALPSGVNSFEASVAISGSRVLVAYSLAGVGQWHVRVLRGSDLALEADLPIPPFDGPAVSVPVLVASSDGSSAFLLANSGRHRIDLLPQ